MWGKKKEEKFVELDRQENETAVEYFRRWAASKGIAVPAVTKAAIEEDPNVPCESCKHLVNKDQTIQVDWLQEIHVVPKTDYAHLVALSARMPRWEWQRETLYFGHDCWNDLIGLRFFQVVRIDDGLSQHVYDLMTPECLAKRLSVNYFNLETVEGLDSKVYKEVTFEDLVMVEPIECHLEHVEVPVKDEEDWGFWG